MSIKVKVKSRCIFERKKERFNLFIYLSKRCKLETNYQYKFISRLFVLFASQNTI